MDDYLSVAPLIEAHLNAEVAGATIKSTWGMPKIFEDFALPPAVMIFLESDRPGEIGNFGASQKVEQLWLCLVVVKDSEYEAGPLISQVIRAMNGWKPEGNTFSAFQRAKTNFLHDYSPNGVLYFPLAFTTSFIFNN